MGSSFKNAFRQVGVTGRRFERGQVYLIKDEVVAFPEERLPARQERQRHESRPVLILQSDADNDDPLYPSVLVAPISHRVELQDHRDFRLQANQAGLEFDSIVHLGLVQPVLKVDLESNPLGKIDPLTMDSIDAVLAANLGLIERP